MFLKNIKKAFALALITMIIIPQSILAYSNKIVAGGETIGIEVKSDGVIIAGFYKVGDYYPSSESKLKKGDKIIKSDEYDIKTIDDFVMSIKNSNQRNVKITYVRNNSRFTTNLKLVNENGTIKTGLYIKDTISGIGTLSYIDPKTKLYGALGHEIIESSSGTKVDIKDGKIYESSITSIEKSVRGEPGAKKAATNSDNIFGNIKENTISGIFGNYSNNYDKTKLYNVLDYKDIKLGKAQILTVLEGNKKEAYDINIIKINDDRESNKNILFEVTNEKLLNKTGGIVQGMSGSPIIQGNNIVGAVTNVVVNDPKKGYGILITTMLKEAEN